MARCASGMAPKRSAAARSCSFTRAGAHWIPDVLSKDAGQITVHRQSRGWCRGSVNAGDEQVTMTADDEAAGEDTFDGVHKDMPSTQHNEAAGEGTFHGVPTNRSGAGQLTCRS